LIFGFMVGGGLPLNPNIKVDIWHPTVGLRCRNPPMHFSQLKVRTIPLTVSNINFDIWILFCGGGLNKYPMTNILRMAKFFPTWGLSQRYCPSL
jgi:hypothetical protein